MRTTRTVFLETERLTLRRFTGADADLLGGLHGDPDVMRFISAAPEPPETVREEVLPRILRRYQEHRGLGAWAAEERATGAFLGWFELRPCDPVQPVAELGYRLHRAAWGRGYATEGSRALVRKAFTELGIERVVAETMTVNRASRRVLEKAGLRYVRTFHATWPEYVEGAEHGDVRYEAERAARPAGHGPPPS
ncbi:GNAT family N-acetyltransferase [Streptomyces sp. Ru87]|uniref:GNAT family N-acetyltransferase n=1 Tax=Streptomyces sp. Ru87 TaxID=2044307 RepID=UPI000BF4EA2D|nr:GNAT family N-acetyltransferase [Streptomyces sp. Ru87]PGH51789.1 GNAT family N-acetyltransferase [Streptomyces sp. Ru87]